MSEPCKLFKYPAESFPFKFDFSNRVQIAEDSQTLAATNLAVTETQLEGTGTIVVGSPTISTNEVHVNISAGDVGDVWELLCNVETATGYTLQHRARIEIARPCD